MSQILNGPASSRLAGVSVGVWMSQLEFMGSWLELWDSWLEFLQSQLEKSTSQL